METIVLTFINDLNMRKFVTTFRISDSDCSVMFFDSLDEKKNPNLENNLKEVGSEGSTFVRSIMKIRGISTICVDQNSFVVIKKNRASWSKISPMILKELRKYQP